MIDRDFAPREIDIQERKLSRKLRIQVTLSYWVSFAIGFVLDCSLVVLLLYVIYLLYLKLV